MDVSTQKIYDNGRKFTVRYHGECKKMVEDKVMHAFAQADTMASPTMTKVYPDGEGWSAELTWWSVD